LWFKPRPQPNKIPILWRFLPILEFGIMMVSSREAS
jgi:hypothetical protein